MKRKSLIVLLVLLLVGILAFTVFACNNDKPNKPNTGTTPGGEGPGPDDDDPPEEETYAIVEALPKLVTGLDKVAATVGDINEGKAAYLGADIGLNFGVTAEGLDVAADLDLSLKVSVDEGKAANNWALIGLNSDGKEVAQLFIHAEAANKEVIYIKEALTGNDNWKRLSVLDTSDSDLTGLFTTPGGVEPDANYNDEGVAGFDTETGYHHVYSGGLIGRLFGLIDVMTNGTKVGEEYMFAKPVYKTEGTGDDEHEVFVRQSRRRRFACGSFRQRQQIRCYFEPRRYRRLDRRSYGHFRFGRLSKNFGKADPRPQTCFGYGGQRR